MRGPRKDGSAFYQGYCVDIMNWIAYLLKLRWKYYYYNARTIQFLYFWKCYQNHFPPSESN